VGVPDPVDARLLALIAEVGRVAVHDLARHVGMDARDVAARLAGLAATGLPLVVGVECDQAGLRYALSHGWPPAPPPMRPPPMRPAPTHAGPVHPGSLHTWGPPGSANWARSDDLDTTTVRTAPARRSTGRIGDTLHAEGPQGQPLSLRLVEVVDPADYLFTAAGYRLQPGERAVVVHTELTNRGGVRFESLPDLYLVLIDAAGQTVAKAPVALSSRPPYRIGVLPGQTAAGHTVYVVPQATALVAVRWSVSPDDDRRAVTWRLK
jgi:hypothetical protein